MGVAIVGATAVWPHPPPNPEEPFFLEFHIAYNLASPAKAPAVRPENVVLSFNQRDPRMLKPQAVGVDPTDRLYKIRIDLPPPGGRFLAYSVPLVYESSSESNPTVNPLQICLVRREKDPRDSNLRYARLDCKEGAGCSLHRDDPGWVAPCAEGVKSEFFRVHVGTVAFAQGGRAPTGQAPGWRVPSLATLRSMPPEKRTGYTEFLIEAGPHPQLAGTDSVSYAIIVNGLQVAIDGWPSDYVRLPFDTAKGLSLSFGLQNLNFSGAAGGCETIEMLLSFRDQDKLVRQIRLYRQYAALRDADPVDITAAGGIAFRWGGKYIHPITEDRYEVFVGSSSDVKYSTLLKSRIDAAQLAFAGKQLVGVVRPPLIESVYGVVVGLRQPNGQVQFTFREAEAVGLKNWIAQSAGDPTLKKLFLYTPMLYKTRGSGGTPKYRPCLQAGSGT
jgi:hypothetical protein